MPQNHSYFIAITLPEPLHTEVEEIKKHISKTYHTKSVLKSPVHITIVPPFFWGNEAELLETVTQFSFSPFSIQLKNHQRFEQRVVFINVVENPLLMNLYKDFNTSFFQKFSGLNKKRPYIFHPHITIGNRDWKPEYFNKCWNDFKDKKYENSFECKKLTLLKNVNNLWITVNK